VESQQGNVKEAAMKILGINDEVTTCSCCGKDNLKKTVILEDDAGREVRYGTECAANALRLSKLQVEKEVRRVVREKADAAAKEKARQDYEWWTNYAAWMLKTYGDTNSNLERSRAYRAAMAV
jgi:hypothetical protein